MDICKERQFFNAPEKGILMALRNINGGKGDKKQPLIDSTSKRGANTIRIKVMLRH